MDMNNISSTSAAYTTNATYQKASTKPAGETAKKQEDKGAVYEKSEKPSSKSENYSVNRDAIVAKMKADTEQRTSQMRSMVESMMKNQGQHIGTADSMWRFLAGGKFTVTAEAKSQAQAAIAEDGYWGVEQTSDRIVEFAKALTGGDASKAEKMRAAFEKGFKQATKSWGQKLPSISGQTYDAVMKKFDNWVGKTAETDGTATE